MEKLMKNKHNYYKRMTAVITLAVTGVVLGPSGVFAGTAAEGIQDGLKSTESAAGGSDLNQSIDTVVGILLFLIGVIAVIAIIIGGIRYTTSNGDAGQTKAAKDTIMYAVIGLIVAIMAYAIVRWVVDVFV